MNQETDKYRHELKYICTAAQLAVLNQRATNLLQLDSHADQTGTYTVRSLYFDDMYNTCFNENEEGTDPREKFRLRIYNADPSAIQLELKKKVRGKTRKQSCRITPQQCQSLMRGEAPPVDASQPFLLQKLGVCMRTRRMAPKVIVEYLRTPFVYPLGNVQVTFDQNIASSSAVQDFLQPNIQKRPIMPKGQQVLEVKFDEYLPDYIHNLLQLENLQQTAFSKYYLSRIYSI